MNVDAETYERLWHVIAGAHDVSDLQARSNLDVHSCRAISGSAVEIVGTQTREADRVIALFVLAAAISGYRGNGIRLFREPPGRDVEVERLIVPVLRR